MAVIQTTDCGGMGIRLFLIQGIFVLVLMGAWADPVKTSCEQARIDLRAAQLPENWLQETTGGGKSTLRSNATLHKLYEKITIGGLHEFFRVIIKTQSELLF